MAVGKSEIEIARFARDRRENARMYDWLVDGTAAAPYYVLFCKCKTQKRVVFRNTVVRAG